ncbi:Extracellular calcium-sensing receptor [Exaiptasia diaphana]|nr:Extracellular calcium-sensing receptor [Exaiptasia diaphana]
MPIGPNHDCRDFKVLKVGSPELIEVSRTVVIGSNKPKVIVKILSHFGWKHIGLLVSDDIHWKPLALEFKNLANSQEICINIDEFISDDSKTVETVVNQINSSNDTHVIVLFASFSDATKVFQRASDINLNGKLWISTEMLPPDIAAEYGNTLQGMIAIEREPERIDGFAKYFTTLNPTKNKWNPWFKILWEKLFNCRFSKYAENDKGESQDDKPSCSGKENFKWIGQILSFSHAIHVIDAVMAATHVIKNICQDTVGNNATNARDQCLEKLTKDRISKEMFKGPFAFQSLFNKTVSLDKNGNAVGSYVIFNLKQDYNGIHFHKAGMYKSDEDELIINKSVISWPREFQPVEICRTICRPGFYKDYESSKCCWKCKACPIGTISKSINTNKCATCPEGSISNMKRTSCTKPVPKYFDWGSSGSVTLTIISLTSFLFSLIVFSVLLKFRTSPVVSGWGSSVNFYLICSITIGVLVPFAFIGYPTEVMCKLQVVTVATSLTLSLSLVLVKIRQITCKKKNMVSRWRVLSYAQKQTIYALFFVILQILFCILWIIVNPPYVKVDNNDQGKIILCSNQNAS